MEEVPGDAIRMKAVLPVVQVHEIVFASEIDLYRFLNIRTVDIDFPANKGWVT